MMQRDWGKILSFCYCIMKHVPRQMHKYSPLLHIITLKVIKLLRYAVYEKVIHNDRYFDYSHSCCAYLYIKTYANKSIITLAETLIVNICMNPFI